MRARILSALVVVVVGAFLVAGHARGEEPGVIKIGSVGPMTGDQAKLGADQSNAVKLAVDQANAAGEVIPGYKLAVVELDDQHDPAQAVSAAKRLVADPAVMAVVGHVTSGASKPAAKVYAQAGLVQITPSSTNPAISQMGYRTFFRTCTTDDIQGPAAAAFAVSKLGAKRLYVIDDKTTYGKGLADEFDKKARELGAEILGHQGIAQGDKDFTPVLTRVLGTNPDLLYFGGMYPEGALLAKQARDLGIRAIFMGGDGLRPDDFIALAGPAAEGAYCTAIGGDVTLMPTAKQFVEAYRSRYGEPGTFSAHAYDATNIIIEAIRRAGRKDRAAILETVRNTQDFQGALGPTSFDSNGDTTNKLIGVFQVVKAAYKYMGPAE